MTLDQYKKQYNFAPYDLTDYAIGATEVEDNKELMVAAFAYLEAKRDFEDQLELHNVEMG